MLSLYLSRVLAILCRHKYVVNAIILALLIISHMELYVDYVGLSITSNGVNSIQDVIQNWKIKNFNIVGH